MAVRWCLRLFGVVGLTMRAVAALPAMEPVRPLTVQGAGVDAVQAALNAAATGDAAQLSALDPAWWRDPPAVALADDLWIRWTRLLPQACERGRLPIDSVTPAWSDDERDLVEPGAAAGALRRAWDRGALMTVLDDAAWCVALGGSASRTYATLAEPLLGLDTVSRAPGFPIEDDPLPAPVASGAFAVADGWLLGLGPHDQAHSPARAAVHVVWQRPLVRGSRVVWSAAAALVSAPDGAWRIDRLGARLRLPAVPPGVEPLAVTAEAAWFGDRDRRLWRLRSDGTIDTLRLPGRRMGAPLVQAGASWWLTPLRIVAWPIAGDPVGIPQALPLSADARLIGPPARIRDGARAWRVPGAPLADPAWARCRDPLDQPLDAEGQAGWPEHRRDAVLLPALPIAWPSSSAPLGPAHPRTSAAVSSFATAPTITDHGAWFELGAGAAGRGWRQRFERQPLDQAPTLQAARIPHAVAVLEGDRHLRLLDATSGRLLVDDWLPADAAVDRVVRLGDGGWAATTPPGIDAVLLLRRASQPLQRITLPRSARQLIGLADGVIAIDDRGGWAWPEGLPVALPEDLSRTALRGDDHGLWSDDRGWPWSTLNGR